MIEGLTRSKFLWGSLVTTLVLVLFNVLVLKNWCNLYFFLTATYDYSCRVTQTVQDAFVLSIAGFALTIFPLLILCALLPIASFNSWKMFSVWAAPLTALLTFFIARMSDGGGVGVVGFHPGLIYIPLLYGTYFLISIGIIAVSAFRSRRGNGKS